MSVSAVVSPAEPALSCGILTLDSCARQIMANPAASASIVAAMISATVTIAGLRFAYVQIRTTREQHEEERRWKRSEFVRSLLSELVSDPNIALICRVFDWREGPARIPDYYLPLFDHVRASSEPPAWDRPRIADCFFEIDWARFVDALQIMREDKSPSAEWRQPDKYMYRSCFDSFCTFIQGVSEDVRALGVKASEYVDLSFYCHRVVFPRDASRALDVAAQGKIRAYIEHYYNEKTYDMILVQAEVYALSHSEEPRPSVEFPDRPCPYPTLETLRAIDRRQGRTG
jgi:hypothetical protein